MKSKKSLWDIIIEPKQQIPREKQLFSNKDLKALIIPIVIEQLLTLLVGVVDTFMVSYAGEAAISGVALVNQINNLFVLIFSSLAAGGSVVVSQYIGTKDRKRAGIAASQLFMVSAVIAALIAAIVLIFGNSILRLLFGEVEDDVMEAGMTYMRILAYSYIFLGVYNACAGIYRSMGDTKTLMLVSMGMNIVNVIGNAIGIFVLKAGVAGVAYPSLISRALACVVMTILVCRPQHFVTVSIRYIFSFNWQMIRRIFSIGLPNCIENGLFQLTKIAVISIVALFGTAQIAANGVAQSIWALSAMFCLAMGPAFITVIGRYMGAGDTEGATYYMHKLLRITIFWATLWNFSFIGISFLLLKIYSLSEAAAFYAIIMIIIHNALNGIVCAFSYSLANGLRAAGDARYTMVSSLISSVGVRGIFSLIFGLWLGWGVIGTSIAMVMDWLTKAILIWIRFKSGKWKYFKVI